MLYLALLVAAAAVGGGQGGHLADVLAESCAIADGRTPPAWAPRPESAFCRAAALAGAVPSDGQRLVEPAFWSEFAASEARDFVGRWEFYQRHADRDTLEIVPSVSDPAVAFPPDVSVTIRFAHSGPGGGHVEHVYAMDNYRFAFLSLPYVVDGPAPHAAAVTCIDGFYLDIDADMCRPLPACPPGSVLYDELCVSPSACRGSGGTYVVDGERWECPPSGVLDILIAAPDPAAPPLASDDTTHLAPSNPCGSAGLESTPCADQAASGAPRTGGGTGEGTYAELVALRFVDGWGFYRHYADKGTLEVSPPEAGAGGPAPEVGATLRFDYAGHQRNFVGRWMAGGTFEHTLGIGALAGGRVMPVMVDGKPAPGAQVRCPDGYFHDWADTECWFEPKCPAGAAVRDGICQQAPGWEYFHAGRPFYAPADGGDDADRYWETAWEDAMYDPLRALAVLAGAGVVAVLAAVVWRAARGEKGLRRSGGQAGGRGNAARSAVAARPLAGRL